jgi:hypothetical protein
MQRLLLLLVVANMLLACSSEERSGPDRSSLSADALVCLDGANAMIDIAREAVNDTRSREQRRESRRVLMEGWIARLNAGEEPCAVYEDIMLAAIAF